MRGVGLMYTMLNVFPVNRYDLCVVSVKTNTIIMPITTGVILESDGINRIPNFRDTTDAGQESIGLQLRYFVKLVRALQRAARFKKTF